MCYRWCYATIVLKKWEIFAAWLLALSLCICFSGVWILIGTPKNEAVAALLGVGVVMSASFLLFGIGACVANSCRPKPPKIQYWAVNTEDACAIPVDHLAELEKESERHLGPIPAMTQPKTIVVPKTPAPSRSGSRVFKTPAKSSKLQKQQSEHKRVEQAAAVALAHAAAGIEMPAAAPQVEDGIEEEMKAEPAVQV